MDELRSLAEAIDADGGMWLPVNGSTLHPLVRHGDSACVHACAATDLRAGDIALVRRASVWMLRIVVQPAPLVTAPLRGPPSDEYGDVLGRVTALRRRGRTRRFGLTQRRAGLLLRRALTTRLYARARSTRVLHKLRSLPDTIHALPMFRPMRASRLGPIDVRLLVPDDAAALDRFARAWLPHLLEMLRHQLAERWQSPDGFAYGAFTAGGDMVGFVFVDEYTQEGIELPGVWVRALKVIPDARRLGIARRLVEAACATATSRGAPRLFADINAGNAPSLRLFGALNFHAAGADVDALLLGQFPDPDNVRPMVTYVRELK